MLGRVGGVPGRDREDGGDTDRGIYVGRPRGRGIPLERGLGQHQHADPHERAERESERGSVPTVDREHETDQSEAEHTAGRGEGDELQPTRRPATEESPVGSRCVL